MLGASIQSTGRTHVSSTVGAHSLSSSRLTSPHGAYPHAAMAGPSSDSILWSIPRLTFRRHLPGIAELSRVVSCLAIAKSYDRPYLICTLFQLLTFDALVSILVDVSPRLARHLESNEAEEVLEKGKHARDHILIPGRIPNPLPSPGYRQSVSSLCHLRTLNVRGNLFCRSVAAS